MNAFKLKQKRLDTIYKTLILKTRNFANQKHLYNLITDKYCLENNSKQTNLQLHGI